MSQIDFTNVNGKTETELKKQLDKIVEKKFDLVQSPIIVERHDLSGARWYSPTDEWWEENGKGEKPYFKSITTIPQALDKGIGFHKFYGNSPSFELANEYANERANIGTIVHVLIKDLLLGDKIIFDDLALLEHPDLRDYENISSVYRRNKKEIIKYLMSFKQFHIDRDPAPLALEIPLMNVSQDEGGNYKYPFAGTLDFVGHVIGTYKKVKLSYLDWKTGKPYKEHWLQAIASKILWDSLFEQPLEALGCVYLKSGWRGTPSYDIVWHEFKPELWAGAIIADETRYYMNHKNAEIGERILPNIPQDLPTEISLEEENENTK